MRTTENEQHYSTRERQTLIYKFLLENSNKNKAVATQWIKDYLDTFDIKTHINTLYADLKEIELTYGVTIEYDQKKKGYKLTDTLFEPYEIQLIAQSLQAFKYISNSKASDITEKLKTLTDNDTAATLNSVGINAVDRIHRQSDSILTQVKRIEKAIQEDKKIRIKYKTGRRYFIMLCGTKNETPSSRAKTRISKESYVDNGYIISPYHLYWKNGDLHLIAGLLVDEDGNPESKAVNFASFRVDKLCIISKPLDMPRDGNNEYEELKRKFKGKREFDFDELMGREIKQVKMQFFSPVKMKY